MTVTYSKAKIIYEGNGATTRWDIPFAFMSPADLQVYIVEGKDKQQLLSSDYLFDPLGKAIIYPHPDGDTPVLAAGKQLMILRTTPLTQQTAFGMQERFDPSVLERAYDKAMMIAQEQAERLDRAIMFPAADAVSSTDAAAYLNQLQTAVGQAELASQSAQESVTSAQTVVQTAVEASAAAQEAVSDLESYVSAANEAQRQAILSQTAAAESAQQAAQEAQNAQSASASAAEHAVQMQETSSFIQTQVQQVQVLSEQAHQSAQTAEQGKNQAAVSALGASEAAQTASLWATKPDEPVEENKYSSKYYAERAAFFAGAAQTHLPLLMSFFTDHQLNDISWLRADTFSWQDGNVYTAAYNELETEVNNWLSEHDWETDHQMDGSTWFLTTAKGYKVVLDADHGSEVLNNMLNTKGVAWYYLIDRTNRRFKLPRTKFGFTGLRTAVGDYVAESLPNITGSMIPWAYKGNQEKGAFYSEGETKNSYNVQGTNSGKEIFFNASLSSSTYQDGAPVQERATQMYLYFYVGNYEREAIVQTAGLNAELFNDKTDRNAANLSAGGKALIAGLGMPSSKYIDLTLGASESTYTAPANGYFCLFANGETENSFCQLVYGYKIVSRLSDDGDFGIYIPCKKGEAIIVQYSAINLNQSYHFFKFVYAEGAQ